MKDVNQIINKNDREFIEIFKLPVLSEQAKQNAIENYRNHFLEYSGEITTHLQEHFEEILDEAGFPIDDIHWSLGYCQGDGVGFYGGIELESLFKKYPELLDYIPTCKKIIGIYNSTHPKDMCSELDFDDVFDLTIIRTNHFYHHEKSMGLSINLYVNDIETYLEEIDEKIKGSLIPDNEVNMNDWTITHVEDNKWTIEDDSHIWTVTIDNEGTAQYEDEGIGLPDAVKRAFNERSNSKSEHRYYPGIYLSAAMVEKEMDDLEKAIETIIKETSSKMEKEGYEIYESMITDEAITTRIEDKGIRFDIAGDIIRTEIAI